MEVVGPEWATVAAVFAERCQTCHSAMPTQEGFDQPPLGMVMDTPKQIKFKAASIYQRTVLLKTMPIGNITGMTDEERALVAAWYESGARIPAQ